MQLAFYSSSFSHNREEYATRLLFIDALTCVALTLFWTTLDQISGSVLFKCRTNQSHFGHLLPRESTPLFKLSTPLYKAIQYKLMHTHAIWCRTNLATSCRQEISVEIFLHINCHAASNGHWLLKYALMNAILVSY